ncbi:MAG: ATP-binding protein [Gemmatimonadales bacterium]
MSRSRSLSLGTRLLLPLLPTAAAIMVAYALWALVEREETMAPETRQETQAYATALSLAFDYALRDVKHENVQEILNRVSRAPTVYGVLVYDAAGARTFSSDILRVPGAPPRAVLREVLRTGQSATYEREIDDQRVFSVLQPIHAPAGEITGALEVAQPLAFIEAEQARVRRRFLLNTLTLLGALAVVTLWLVRRVVAKPMDRMVEAAHALGGGDLSYRIPEQAEARELGQLAREFNTMAGRLEAARAASELEAEKRVILERRLQESEKLAAIGDLAAGLAHEIAAPLNVISGRAELLLRRPSDTPARERNLRIIVQQIGRITTIVRNLLDFARRREPQVQRIELAGVVDGVIEFLDGELERSSVSLVRDDTRGLWVSADPDLLHQVLVNLVLNAVQAMENAMGERRMIIRSGLDDTTVWLEVEDTGPGIAPDALGRLFEPFYTTKPRGTGLGLGVSRNIVEEHDGQLSAANAASGGAVLRLTLPAEPARRELAANA